MPIRIGLAEDSYLEREGTRLLLAIHEDIELVASMGHLDALLAAVDHHDPDVVLTDIRMPPSGTDEGIRTAETLADTHPDLGVAVLSQYVGPEYALRLFDGGARGRAYLVKERLADVTELRHAIETVRSGGTMLDPLVVTSILCWDAGPISAAVRRAAITSGGVNGSAHRTIAGNWAGGS
jgi:DNA-binding NarL/FixJ family response regulator